MTKSIFQDRNFGVRLHEIRDRHELSQKAVSILAGMDQSYLAGLEAGRRSPPREKQLIRLIMALGATPDEERELREAHAISRLVSVVAEINSEGGKELAAIAYRFLKYSPDEIKFAQKCARSTSAVS